MCLRDAIILGFTPAPLEIAYTTIELPITLTFPREKKDASAASLTLGTWLPDTSIRLVRQLSMYLKRERKIIIHYFTIN